MRFYLCIFLLSITLVQAQTYEAGVILGGTNALSDVGLRVRVRVRGQMSDDRVTLCLRGMSGECSASRRHNHMGLGG